MAVAPIANMDEWMRDVTRQLTQLRRRLRASANVESVGRSAVLSAGTVLRDNGDGTFTVVGFDAGSGDSPE